MPTFTQISAYVDSLNRLKKNRTDELYDQLVKSKFPVIKKDVAVFLSQIVTLKQPERILEIGTNVGYSAIVMALAMDRGEIVSIDYRTDQHETARVNFKDFGVEKRIRLITGYAEKVLSEAGSNFDLVFIDADKKGYSVYLDFAVKNLNPGGIIIADNLFWKGSVIKPPKEKDRRDIAGSLQKFNIKFSTLKGFKSQILSIGDGLGFAVKET